MKKYDYIVYKTTNLINGMIYVGYDSFNRPEYYGSGIYFYRAIHKIIKDYVEHILNEDFNPGKSNKTLQKRYKHINLIFLKKEILEHYNTKEEMINGEIKWIKYFNSTDKNIGYNITNGGDGGDTWEHLDPSKKEIIYKRRKTVYQYDLEYNLINIYHSVKYAASFNNLHRGSISNSCLDKFNHSGNYIWSYHELNYDELTEKINKIKIFNNIYDKRCNKVYQYDLEYNLVNIFNSIREAMRITNIINIRKCCDGKCNHAGNYIWSYNEKT